MKSIDRIKKLEREILDLLEHSMALRDQISLLENKEGKISDEIVTKKRQLSLLKEMNK